MTRVLFALLILTVLYLALRLYQLQRAVTALTRLVEKPRRRSHAIRKEVKELEDELAFIADIVANGAASPEDFVEADAIRDKLDRRLRALGAAPIAAGSCSPR
jgi:cell division protein FtsB